MSPNELPMSSLGQGLYEIEAQPGSSPPQTYFYFLLSAAGSDPQLTFEAVWQQQGSGYRGWLIFLAEAVTDVSTFAAAFRSKLPLPASNTLGIVWLAAQSASTWPASPQSLLMNFVPGQQNYTVDAASTLQFEWSPLQLTLPGGVITVTLRDIFAPIVLNFSAGTLSTLGIPSTPFQVQPSSTTLAISGPTVGAFTLPRTSLSAQSLVQYFGCGMNYTYQEAGADQNLFFPFLTSPPTTEQIWNVSLHPLFPVNSEQTAFAPVLTSAFVCPNYLTTLGQTVTLTPTTDFRFAFCSGPANLIFGDAPAVPGSSRYYMVPAGTFTIGTGASTGQPFRWMCGLFGPEYMQLVEGDSIRFVSPMPANAWSFPPQGNAGSNSAPPLDATYTTAWVTWPGAAAGAVRGYYAQPSTSVYYSQSGGNPGLAVNARISQIEQLAQFPIVPYGGVFGAPVNSQVTAQLLQSFESLVLSGARHEVFTTAQGPTFLPPDSISSSNEDLLTAEAETMYNAVTPQGFLVSLDGGQWSQLFLALSPTQPGQYLSFGSGSPGKLVSPPLANVLLQNQLFLVVSGDQNLGQFQSILDVAGFNIELSLASTTPPLSPSENRTILIFKFNTSSTLMDMVSQPSLWTASNQFVPDVAATQQAIQQAIAQAASLGGSPANDPFNNFNTLVNSATWTGVLALNCVVDGAGMPEDLQMLLGGINGPLRMHHFGIESNSIVSGSPSSPGHLDIAKSSLFGVIYYQNDTGESPPASGLDYEVQQLIVVFQNSAITRFDAQVALVIDQLFGRSVALKSGGALPHIPNGLILNGQYQVVNGIATVKFSTATPVEFDFTADNGASRVLDRIVFTGASLAPLPSEGSPGVVNADFNLEGQLYFRQTPFPTAAGLDLFSFGTDTAGLPFSGMTIHMHFQLDSQGILIPSSKQLSFDASQLSVSPAANSVRRSSLLYSLPLKLSRFVDAPKGLSMDGMSPVHVLQLESSGSQVASPNSGPPGNFPYVTTRPVFALEFDVTLGSLGSLSDVHAALTAKLQLGWGPSQVVPDNDGAAVLVQLPSAMAGYGGFNLEGIVKTTFGDANLLMVELDGGTRVVYAIMFGNIQLSILGYSFPPKVIVDFLLFAGASTADAPTSSNNLGWFLAAFQPQSNSTPSLVSIP